MPLEKSTSVGNIKAKESQQEIYKHWQNRMMFFMMVAYAASYFSRQNFPQAMGVMESSLGFTKLQLGNIVSIFGIIYGCGRFISGILGDQNSARLFLACGLFFSGLANIFMGFSSSLILLTLVWSLNSCFLSTGAPACAKIITHWFSPKELATKWALWSTSQQIGMALVSVVLAWALPRFGWKCAFFLPGGVSLVLSLLVYKGLRDKPEDLGLDTVEKFSGLSQANADECSKMTFSQILFKKVLRNKMVWAMGLANCFLYITRMGFLTWAPIFLCQDKHISFRSSGFMMGAFNIAGIIGAILLGMLADKTFKGYRGRAGFTFMFGLALSVLGIWFVPSANPWVYLAAVLTFGFFVSGPQTMVGVAAVDFSSKRAAGAASGLTGTCGYVGTALAGSGLALIEGKYGWTGVFAALFSSALAGSLCFLATWNARARSLEASEKKTKKITLEKAA
ncbi:MFS transporter [Alphaproteobacteria bacterium]|nr:MFS transporter [Alphaproteobacteria bacterium]GHS98808.1 MFS transporter [Alphaproteobacteria bacterium]